MKNLSIVLLGFFVVIFGWKFAHADEYEIDYAQSTIGFQTQHTGNDVNGVIGKWHGDITFSAQELAASAVTAVFDMDSAKTGDKIFDGTLPQTDWFDVKKHPQANFKSVSFEQAEQGGFILRGSFTLKEITNDVVIPFTLVEEGDNKVRAKGTFTLNRLDYALGQVADPKAAWVDENVTVSFDIVATQL